MFVYEIHDGLNHNVHTHARALIRRYSGDECNIIYGKMYWMRGGFRPQGARSRLPLYLYTIIIWFKTKTSG